MVRKERNWLRRLPIVLLAAAIASMAGGSSQALAQRWQATFGGPTCPETGMKGVTPLTSGGYVAVGETKSQDPGCSGTDVYVVKADNSGNLVWSFIYDVGGGDNRATCVAECSNGDIIITGSTANSGSFCNPNDAFLMRLDPLGGVLWSRTYGSALDEGGEYVIEMTTGNGGTTNSGDFVVVGWARGSNGIKEAYALRTTSAGTLIWDRAYQLGTSSERYYLTADESVVGANWGTILAAGRGGTGYAQWSRINGNTGALINHVLFADSMLIRSIEELTVGAEAGNIVMTGEILNQYGTNSEVWVVKVGAACLSNPYLNAYFGDNGPNPDVGHCIREIKSGNNAGNLVITGSMYINGGLGNSDAFLLELTPQLQMAFPGVSVYGGYNNDVGMSIAEVPSSLPQRTRGFIIAGYTESAGLIPPGDVRQLYLVRPDSVHVSGCHEFLAHPVVHPNQEAPRKCYTTSVVRSVATACTPSVYGTPVTWSNRLCFDPQETDGFSARPRNGGGNDGISGIGEERSKEGDGALLPYPNPVKRGGTVTVEFSLGHAANTTVRIADALGKVIYDGSRDCPSGLNAVSITTTEWPAGAYTIMIDDGDGIKSRKVLITE